MGDALTVGSLFVFLLTTTAPAPAPSPSATPLTEIGHVHATTALCQTMLSDAADAVGFDADDDVKLRTMYRTMQTADFDSNQIVKHRSTQLLDAQFVALRASAVSGIATVRKLRDEAAQTSDDDQRKALVKFADALAGALYRQKVLADDLGRFVAYLDSQQPISDEDKLQMQFDAMRAQNYYSMTQTHLTARKAYTSPLEAIPMQLSAIAKYAADEFADRALPIVDDERRANALIEPSFAGC